jgi:hypothetical protein
MFARRGPKALIACRIALVRLRADFDTLVHLM